jgi:ABC-2 type transport system permease protein
MMALVIPIFELVLFGVIDTNVKHVRTAVFDQSRTRESRELIADLVNTVFFQVVEEAPSRAALRESIVAGRASVGVEIPPDYARKRLRNEPADFLVLIDGSDSTVASQTLAAANGVALERSLEVISRSIGTQGLAIQAHPILLFNPDSRSANLLIPGLIAILLTFSGTVLAAFGIVRERSAARWSSSWSRRLRPSASSWASSSPTWRSASSSSSRSWS